MKKRQNWNTYRNKIEIAATEIKKFIESCIKYVVYIIFI